MTSAFLSIQVIATRFYQALAVLMLAAVLSACGATTDNPVTSIGNGPVEPIPPSGDLAPPPGGDQTDTNPPTVSFSFPAAGQTVSGTVSVTVSATDNVGVAGVQLYLDGNRLLIDDTQPPYSHAWNTLNEANGTHTLSAIAKDVAGNLSTTASRSITVNNDKTLPSVSITAPAGNATVFGSVTVSASASDNVDVAGIQFRLDGADLGSEDGTAPYSISWNTTQVTNGNHTLSAVARDVAGNIKNSSDVVVSVNNSSSSQFPNAAFPLHVEPGKRYLLDADGKPFLMNGEAAWGLIVQLNREQAEAYLDDRKSKGINTLLVMLIAKHYLISNSPANAYGANPFRVDGDFGTPNEDYFLHADWVINRAAERGFLILLAPSYTGFEGSGSEGWFPEMVDNGATKLRAYGQFVGQRYKNLKNVLWLEGGDFRPPESGQDLIRAVANGIRDADTGSLHTFHANRNTAALEYWGTSESWLSVNDIYTDEDSVVQEAFTEFSRSTAPFFLVEARYENEGADGALVRTQAFQAILSGSFGHVMGNRPIWGFMSGWESALESEGSRTIQHVRTVLEGHDWWTLLPDISASLMTGGLGSGRSRAVAALSLDRSFGVLYVPDERTVTVNLTKLAGPNVAIQWCDPTSGTCHTATGSPRASNSSISLSTPGLNGEGASDWVMTLDSQP